MNPLRWLSILVATCIACGAQNVGITYDVRIFQVTCPVTNHLYAGSGIQPPVGEPIIVQLKEHSWTPTHGYHLNYQGDILYWDRVEEPDNPNITRIARNDNLSVEGTLSVIQDLPTHYLAPRDDGRYDLKLSQYEAGIRVRLQYIGGGTTNLWYNDSRTLQREPLPDVQLDVGKPKESVWSKVRIATPADTWADCALFGPGPADGPSVLVFVRMRATPEVLAAADELMAGEKYAIDLKVMKVPHKAAAKLASDIETDPTFTTLTGDVRPIAKINVDGNTIPLNDKNAFDRLIGGIKGIQLLSAPRVTVFSEQAARIREGGTPANADGGKARPWATEWNDDPYLGDLVKEQRPGTAIFATTTEIPTLGSDANGTIAYQWTGLVAALSVKSGSQPNAIIVDLAYAMRRKDRKDNFFEQGFRAKFPLQLGVPAWLTFEDKESHERILIQLTADADPDTHAPEPRKVN